MAEASGRNFKRKHGLQHPAVQRLVLLVLKLDSHLMGPLDRSMRRLIVRGKAILPIAFAHSHPPPTGPQQSLTKRCFKGHI